MPWSFIYPSGLEAFPVEILCHILNNLEMHDLLACTMVSKHFKRVIAQSSRLQYSIELQKARMVSLLPPSSSPSFASRLKLLREREKNWKYMDWTRRHTLSVPPTGSVYEFVGGLYGNGREDESRVTGSISFLELPSSDASFLGEPQQELKGWTHSMGDVNIIDFTMDPSQDLLVLVALAPPQAKHVYELHLRSIVTNKPHRKAPLHTLPCWRKSSAPMQTSDLVAAVRVQVCGNLVALLIKEIQDGTGAHLEIWNWEANSQHSCALTRNSGIDDFTFLTSDTFLLVRPAGRFEVYTFTDPSTCRRPTAPVLRVMYSFPQLSPGYMYWYISMSSNPAPGYVPRPRMDKKQDSEIGNKNQIYHPRPEERIHACCLYIFNPANEEAAHVHSFVFFLNLQTLLNPPTEWITKTQALNGAKSVPSMRPSETLLYNRSTANSTAFAATGGSSSASSSPLFYEAPIHESESETSSEVAGSMAPFIPPHYAEQDTTRQSLQYPLFPTFDEHRSPNPVPTGRQLPRIPLQRTSDAKQTEPPRKPRVRQATSPLTSIPLNTEIPWEVWGPQSTRWFEECLSTDWQHAIYGLRTVESINPHHDTNRPVVVDTNANPPPTITPTLDPPTISGSELSSSTQLSLSDGINGGAVAIASSVASTELAIPSSVASTEKPEASSSSHSAHHSPTPNGVGEGGQGQDAEQSDEGSDDYGHENNNGVMPREARRYLRVRDFNPYSFTENGGALIPARKKMKGRGEAQWREPRLVTDASTTPVRGVFTKDIVSSLPYMEILSQEKFEVTDVMMDDCRLLLLKRGQGGKLQRVEVLLM